MCLLAGRQSRVMSLAARCNNTVNALKIKVDQFFFKIAHCAWSLLPCIDSKNV